MGKTQPIGTGQGEFLRRLIGRISTIKVRPRSSTTILSTASKGEHLYYIIFYKATEGTGATATEIIYNATERRFGATAAVLIYNATERRPGAIAVPQLQSDRAEST